MWDQDRLALCLQTGIYRDEFLEELADAYAEEKATLENAYEDPLPDSHWEKWMGVIRKVALKHFEKGKKEKRECGLRDMKKALLKELAELRLRTEGAGDEEMETAKLALKRTDKDSKDLQKSIRAAYTGSLLNDLLAGTGIG